MFGWILENLGTILIGLLLIGIVAAIVVSLIRKKKRGHSCGCGCGGCSGCPEHPEVPARSGLRGEHAADRV